MTATLAAYNALVAGRGQFVRLNPSDPIDAEDTLRQLGFCDQTIANAKAQGFKGCYLMKNSDESEGLYIERPRLTMDL